VKQVRCQDTCRTEDGLQSAVGGLPDGQTGVQTVLLEGIPMVDGSTFDMWVVQGESVSELIRSTRGVGSKTTAVASRVLSERCTDTDRNSRLMLDLGCNLGYLSLLALNLGCDVICIEPNPMLIPIIARSAILNMQRFDDMHSEFVRRGSFVVVHAAAGATTAVLPLSVTRAHMGVSAVIANPNPKTKPEHNSASANRAQQHTEPPQPSERGVEEHDVVVIPVETMLRGSAGVIKIDVEGGELEAIAGLGEWLLEYGYDDMLLEVGDEGQALWRRTGRRRCSSLLRSGATECWNRAVGWKSTMRSSRTSLRTSCKQAPCITLIHCITISGSAAVRGLLTPRQKRTTILHPRLTSKPKP